MKTRFQLLGYIGAIVTPLLLVATAAGQTDPANRAALSAKGFTAADFKAAEQTQIGSNFAFYSRWKDCALRSTSLIVYGGLDTSQLAPALAMGCNDITLELRAALGRNLGLNRATRVIELLITDFGMTTGRTSRMLAQSQRSNHNAQPDEPFWQRDSWTVRLIADKKCGAVMLAGDKDVEGQDRKKMIVYPTVNGYEIGFVIGTSSYFSRLIGKSLKLKSVIVTGDFGNQTLREIDGRYNVRLRTHWS